MNLIFKNNINTRALVRGIHFGILQLFIILFAIGSTEIGLFTLPAIAAQNIFLFRFIVFESPDATDTIVSYVVLAISLTIHLYANYEYGTQFDNYGATLLYGIGFLLSTGLFL